MIPILRISYFFQFLSEKLLRLCSKYQSILVIIRVKRQLVFSAIERSQQASGVVVMCLDEALVDHQSQVHRGQSEHQGGEDQVEEPIHCLRRGKHQIEYPIHCLKKEKHEVDRNKRRAPLCWQSNRSNHHSLTSVLFLCPVFLPFDTLHHKALHFGQF